MRIRNFKQIALVALIMFQLFFVISQSSAVPPLPIGDSGYKQSSPYESNPNNNASSGLTGVSGQPPNARDGDLATYFNFQYGANGYFEVNTFDNTPSPTFTIGWVDLKITYKSVGLGTTDDRYRILLYVSSDTTPTVTNTHLVQDWTNYGEYIYTDLDNSGNVTIGDMRLTTVGMYAAGTTIASGDKDIGTLLIAFKSNEKHTDAGSTVNAYDVGERVYQDSDTSGNVTVNDFRLLMPDGGGFPTGSQVSSGNGDIGNSLVAFAANEKHAENVLVDGKYDPSPVVFPNGASTSSPPANRPWSNITEPNDGVWDWTDIGNIHVRVENLAVGANNFQRFYMYEVWLSVYTTQLPQNGLTLQPTVIQGLNVGDYFFYDVYLHNGTNPISHMWGYQLKIDFDNSVVNATDYFTYSPFVQQFPSEINNTLGYVAVSYASYNGDPGGLTTNAPLVRIYFKVIADGKSVMHFSTTILADIIGGQLHSDVNDGVYTTLPIHDIAVVDAESNTTMFMPGANATVKVTVMNQGTFDETSFSVTAQYDTTTISTQLVTLLKSGLTTRLLFTWNTAGVPLGFHQIRANATVVSGDAYPSNNQFSDGNVLAGHHDIAVTAVTRISPSNITVPEGTILSVEKGKIMYVNVTVSNVGNFSETSINVTAMWKEKNLVIGNATGISVDVGGNRTVTFAWNTTVGYTWPNDRYGNPVNSTDGHVEGIASPVPYEKGIDYDLTADNDLIGGLVRVTRQALAPFAKFNFNPTTPYVGQPVRFDASSSQTPLGTKIEHYTWDFGDTNITQVSDPVVYHTYMSNGTVDGKFSIKLTVTNNVSLSDATVPLNVTVLNRNLRVLGITPSAISVLLGSTVTINVTIVNRGDDYEAFNVTAYYGSSVIGKLNGTGTGGDLAIGHSRILTFLWNTSKVAAGTYIIKAVIDLLPWESNTTDNTFVYGTIGIVWHNIAVTSVVVHPNEVVVGEKVSINVTVVNQGNFTETFTVAVKANDTDVGNQTVTSLAVGASRVLSFSWDTTGVDTGSYTVKALASTVSGETKTIDNTFVGGNVNVKPAQGDQTLLYAAIGIAVIVVIALILLYFFKIRKPK